MRALWPGLGATLLACNAEVGEPRQPHIIDSGAASDAATLQGEALPDSGPEPDQGQETPDLGAVADGSLEPTVPPELEGWRLTWHDEFDAAANTGIDPARWVHDVGGDGWGNGQLEFNTDRISNAGHDGHGHLVLTAREETYRGNAYTSARIRTQGLFTQRYGRFEARIKLPIGQGIWPAFWMLGENIGQVSWPRCGEIDIMEFRGQRPRESTGALHGPGYSAGQSIYGGYPSPSRLPDAFHVFAVEWDASGISWFVDDTQFMGVDRGDQPPGAPWPFDQPFFLILNIAVGGTYVGAPDPSTTFPQRMLVDYVRVYEAAP